MKRVLIITYYWPPGAGAGVQRWLKFVKYLRDYGWEPVVYTPENPEAPAVDPTLEREIPHGIEVLKEPIWEPYTAYKKFVGRKQSDSIKTGFLSEKKKPGITEKIAVWIRGNLFIPDARKFWIKPSVRFLTTYLAKKPVDAIVSSGPPHSMHMIALELKQKTSIPWLADFRDPWTNIDYYHALMLTTRSDARHRKMERRVLENASEVVVVSPGMAKDFQHIVDREYQIITNGFDGEVQSGNPPSTKKFTLMHLGSLVPARNPENLWKSLGTLVKENAGFAAHLEIRLIGQTDISVKEAIAKEGLDGYTSFIPFIPHNQAIEKLSSASLLLLIINNTPNANLILTGKIFEYLQSGRPVLCIGPSTGDAARIITQTRTGKCVEYYDLAAIRDTLLEFYDLFKKEALVIRPENIAVYTRKNLTARLVEVLDGMVRL
jgi:hypothetical protein